jgi:hypothetical protein
MILQTVEMSSSEKASIEEERAGHEFPGHEFQDREFQDRDNLTPGRGAARIVDTAARQIATQQMRYQLSLLDRSQRRMSIEEWTAALLEKAK